MEMNEYRKLMESIDRIDATDSLPAPQSDPIDLVTMDIPLLIRLFELMKETVQDDAELHNIVTQILNVSKQSNGPLNMEDYNQILNRQSDEPVDESTTKYSTHKALYHYDIPDGLIPPGAKSSDDFIEVNRKYVPLRMFTKIDPNENEGFNYKYNNFIMKYNDAYRVYVSATADLDEGY